MHYLGLFLVHLFLEVFEDDTCFRLEFPRFITRSSKGQHLYKNRRCPIAIFGR